MKPPIEFYVIGQPKGQPRAKSCRFGKHSRVYDPGTADEWKMFVRAAANAAWDKIPFDGPLCVNLTFYFPRPKAHYRSNGELKPNAPTWHTSKPDRDNCDKAVLDALTNLGIWRDDSLVCAGGVKKCYADNQPGCKVEIKEAQ